MMERLTKRMDGGAITLSGAAAVDRSLIYRRLAEYEDTGMTPREIIAMQAHAGKFACWMPKAFQIGSGFIYECSRCGDMSSINSAHYCSNCGAKMTDMPEDEGDEQ